MLVDVENAMAGSPHSYSFPRFCRWNHHVSQYTSITSPSYTSFSHWLVAWWMGYPQATTSRYIILNSIPRRPLDLSKSGNMDPLFRGVYYWADGIARLLPSFSHNIPIELYKWLHISVVDFIISYPTNVGKVTINHTCFDDLMVRIPSIHGKSGDGLLLLYSKEI